jgi:3-hydroxybutyryl-CoA dehydrogenase
MGSIEEIDKAMKLGRGHPMGPFALVDYIGLDTICYIANVLFDEFREARFAAPPLLRRLVATGRLGRKSGHGFYDYGQQRSRR